MNLVERLRKAPGSRILDEAANRIEELERELEFQRGEHSTWKVAHAQKCEVIAALKAELKAISVAIDDPRTDLTHTMVEVIQELKAELAEEQAAHLKTHNWLCDRNEEIAALKVPASEPVGYFYQDKYGQWKQAGDPVSFREMVKLFRAPPNTDELVTAFEVLLDDYQYQVGYDENYTKAKAALAKWEGK